MNRLQTSVGWIGFPTYTWVIGKDAYSAESITTEVTRMFDVLLAMTARSSFFGVNYAGTHYASQETRSSFVYKYYFDEFGPQKYEKGLEKASIEYSVFQDNYLDFLLSMFNLLGLEDAYIDMPPPDSDSLVTLDYNYFSNFSISESEYTISEPLALLKRKLTRNVSLTLQLPNFDLSLIASKDAGPRYKVYNLLETGRGAMSLMINVLAQYFCINFSAEAIMLFIMMNQAFFSFKKIKDVLNTLNIDGTLYEARVLELTRASQVMKWVAQALQRQLVPNVDPKAFEYLLGPNANEYIAQQTALKNYKENCVHIRNSLSSTLILQYRMMRFNSQEITPSPNSEVASTSISQSFALAENGTLCKLDSSFKLVQTENLYKVMRLIKRKIVVLDGEIEEINLTNEGDRIIFGQLAPDPSTPDNIDADVQDAIDRSKMMYKSANIPTMSWDDAIAISNALPTRVKQISKSYRYRVTGNINTDDLIGEVFTAFRFLMHDERITTCSVNYDSMSGGGTYQISYIEAN